MITELVYRVVFWVEDNPMVVILLGLAFSLSAAKRLARLTARAWIKRHTIVD